VVSEVQWNKIQGLIQKGIDEGATLVSGGPASRKAWRPATT
jgi:aldehyde dehydrogenase (NAD+)